MFSKHKFEDLYGVEFGVQDNINVYPDRETNQFEIEFTTPNHTEDSVSFSIGMETFVFFRHLIKMEVWDGDELLYETNRRFHFFVNDTGVDPYADKDSGHPMLPRKPRTTHLKPNHTYTLRVYRTTGPRSENPISIQYVATDGNEQPVNTAVGTAIPMTFNGVAGHFIPELDD